MLAHASGNFHGDAALTRRFRGDRRNDDLGAVIALLDGENNNDGPLLRALVPALGGFVGPEVNVGENVSRLRDRP